MGLNHSTYCLRANSDKVKFVNGGLESYEGLTAKDLTIAKMSFARPFENDNDYFDFLKKAEEFKWDAVMFVIE